MKIRIDFSLECFCTTCTLFGGFFHIMKVYYLFISKTLSKSVQNVQKRTSEILMTIFIMVMVCKIVVISKVFYIFCTL